MMKRKVVLLTRTSRPSGAQMAWRILNSEHELSAVIVEERGRMIKDRKWSGFKIIKRYGLRFVARRVWETVEIKAHYHLRRLLKKHFHSHRYLSIEELALDYSVPIIQVDDHNGEETIRLLKEQQPDIGVLTNTRVIKDQVLEIPTQGFLNLHLSALPKYAGLDSIFWALYFGEREIGITVHRAVKKLDRGAIVKQKSLRVFPFDDEHTLYEKALWVGTDLMCRAISDFDQAQTALLEQNMSEASYYSWPSAAERDGLRQRLERRRTKYANLHGVPRVLHVLTRMTRGGAQMNTLASAIGLSQLGYDVTIVTGPSWGPEGEIYTRALESGVEVIQITDVIREINPMRDFLAALKLIRLMRVRRFDIVHTHMSKGGILGRFAAACVNAPLIVHTPHGHIFHSYFSAFKEKIFLVIERMMARVSDKLIALTNQEKREHAELKVGKSKQWEIVPSGVNPALFDTAVFGDAAALKHRHGMPLDVPVVGFVGRLSAIKGVTYFIDSIPLIAADRLKAHFLIVGAGEQESELAEKVKQLGVEARVTMTGHQHNVSELLNLMDVLVVPSLNEGMGRVIAEGGLLKKAVVASAVGGILDLISDEETGLLVERRDPQAIAKATIRLLGDEPLRLRLGNKLNERILGGFTEDWMVSKLDRIYRLAMRDKGIFSDFLTREPDARLKESLMQSDRKHAPSASCSAE